MSHFILIYAFITYKSDHSNEFATAHARGRSIQLYRSVVVLLRVAFQDLLIFYHHILDVLHVIHESFSALKQ